MKKRWRLLLMGMFLGMMVMAGSRAELAAVPLTDLSLQAGSLAVLNETLYGIAEDQLYRLCPDANEAYPLAAVPDGVAWLAPSGNELVGFSPVSGSAHGWQPEHGWRQGVRLEAWDAANVQILGFAASEKTLCFLVFDFDANRPLLWQMGRSSGEIAAQVPADGIVEIASGAQGVIGLRQHPDGTIQYGLVSEKGRFQPWGQAPQGMAFGLAAAGESVWFAVDNAVYEAKGEGYAAQVWRLPTKTISCMQTAVLRGDYFVLDQGQLLRAEAPEEESDGKPLVISAYGSQEIHDKALAATGLQAVVRDEVYFRQEQIAQMLLTQDDAVDVYFMDGVFVDATRIFEKQYAYPLMSQTLWDAAWRMHKPLRELVVREDRLLAIPTACDASTYSLIVDVSVLEDAQKLGYALPATYEEYLTQVAQWPERLAEEGILPLGMTPRYLVEQTLYHVLLSADAPQHVEAGQLAHLLSLAQAAAARLEACERMAGASPRWLFTNQRPGFYQESVSGGRYLPLPLTQGQIARLGVSVSFMFINPYSHHKAEALAY